MVVYIFPAITILLDLGAALVYLFHGNMWKMLYWLAAALITLAVLFM